MIRLLSKRRWLVATAALLALGLYLFVAARLSQPGFPLDDGWIHQTYARSLARTRSWAFVPGEVSAGSTAPLWTLLLTLGYLLRLPYLWWTNLLGGVCLIWLGWAGMRLWELLWPSRAVQSWLAGLVLVLSWPFVWAAGSGMETLLFVALALHILADYTNQQCAKSWKVGRLGLLVGLLILTRPDGLSLLLLLAAGLIVGPEIGRESLDRGARYLAAALIPLVPYFIFNLWSSGAIWPNTFYAKQAEYAFLWDRFILWRFVHLLFFSLGGPESGFRGMSGAHLLLLPGLIWSAWLAFRRDWVGRRIVALLPLLWAGGHVLLYAWRLPVTYQHGRYLWAALPIWLLFGLAGWQDLIAGLMARLPSGSPLASRAAFWLPTVGILTFSLLLVIFLLLGAQVFGQDVAIINGEMVAVAIWLEENTSPDALIAAHDIGAIGFFARRPLLDLAGLITPEVIPLLDDEAAMTLYVQASGADYLVTAPGWSYERLTRPELTELLYTTDLALTREQGSNNMAVYRLRPP